MKNSCPDCRKVFFGKRKFGGKCFNQLIKGMKHRSNTTQLPSYRGTGSICCPSKYLIINELFIELLHFGS